MRMKETRARVVSREEGKDKDMKREITKAKEMER